MTVQRSTQPADAPGFFPRLVISEELFVRFVYIWMRDARLDPEDTFHRSHVEDNLAAVLGGCAPMARPDLEKFARDAVRHAPPGMVL